MIPELYLQCLRVSLFVFILALKIFRFFMLTARTNPPAPNTPIISHPQICKITENHYLGSVSSSTDNLHSSQLSRFPLSSNADRKACAGANSSYPKAQQSKIGQDEGISNY